MDIYDEYWDYCLCTSYARGTYVCMYVTMYRSRTFGPSFDSESKSSDDHVKT